MFVGAMALLWAAPAAAETIYVSNEKSNDISVIDGATLEVVATVEVGQRPRGITLSRDHTVLYICASDDDTVEVLDLATLAIVRTLPSGPDPELFVLHPDGNPLYIDRKSTRLNSSH